MTKFDARGHIEAVLDTLSEGLAPVVTARFQELAPSVANWTDILEHKDREAGRSFARYNPQDLSLILRVFTESFGTLGYPFSGVLGRQAQNWASELRNVRNGWAHNEEFSIAETYRALDTAEMLLRGLQIDAEADLVRGLKAPVLVAMAAQSVSAPPRPRSTFPRHSRRNLRARLPKRLPLSLPLPSRRSRLQAPAEPQRSRSARFPT